MSTENNKALVRRWFEEVWNNGHAEAIDTMIGPETRIHGLADEMMRADGFKAFHAVYRNAFPDVRIQVEDMVAEGDKVAARWTAAVTHRGEGLGIAATGRSARLTGMSIVRIEGEKIVEGWNNFDQLGMFKQLGVANLP